jgi:DNA-binding winged helix-turn-helix (wHTH) protein/Flp pilus assembly protein TadD
MRDTQCSSVVLGDFIVDLAAGGLRTRTGEVIRLRQHAFEVLRVLVYRAGEVVRREDLKRIVWHGQGRSRHVIDTAIKKLRDALGDNARAPRYIDTIPKAGYRLCMPVKPQPATEPSSPGPMLDVEALTLFGVAQDELRKRSRTSVQRALGFYRRVLERHPSFVPALLGVADCLILLAHTGFPVFTPASVLSEARSAVTRAIKLAIEPEVKAAALTAMAKLNLMFDWNFDQAEQQYLAAKALNPSDAAIYHGLGHLYLIMNRFDESLDAIEQARLYAPSSPMIHGTSGWLLYYTRQYDRAIQRCLDTTRHHPQFAAGHVMLGLAHQALGHTSEAEAAFWSSYEVEPSPVPLGALGHLYASIGNAGGVARVTEGLGDLARAGVPVSSFHDALVHVGLRRYDEAMTALRRACDEQCDWLIYLSVDQRWKELRQHAEYEYLLRRLRLYQFWKDQAEE